ncbi:hypothetical protein DPMN_003948 [Dreissena polymorpha]|uniref:Uncharacterized protein n=1 Tax=Dreissena polymorpha TaxID=45954 RepID=A0A9D4RSJ3_DREPO|nr:hypothetical protein DPMN_003948 [Dreissena polymorpha]
MKKAENVTAPGGGMYYDDVASPTFAGSNGLYTTMTTKTETIGGGILKLQISGTAHIDGR